MSVNLLHAMIEAVEDAGLTGRDVHERFDVGITWYNDVKAGRTKSPSVHKVQQIYEELTGDKLLQKNGEPRSKRLPS